LKTSPVVLILRGPPASGKTSAALLLRERLAPAARLSIDTLRYFVHPRPLNEKYLRVAKVAAARMAVEYAASGISSVIESVFMEVDVLNEVCEILRRGNVEHYVFSLYTSLENIEARDTGREWFDRQGSARIKEIHDSFVWLGNIVETQGKIVEEVASEILELLDMLRTPTNKSQVSGCASKADTKICVFVRHGACNIEPSRYNSPDDIILTEMGRSAVAVTASGLVGFAPERLVTSPFRRSVESASIVGRFTGLTPEVDDGLRERHFYSLAGRDYNSLRGIYGDDFVRQLLYSSENLTVEKEETIQEAQQRIVETMKRIMAGPERRIAVVSHGGPFCWLLNAYLGLPLDRNRTIGLAPSHFGIFVYESTGEFRSFRGANLNSWDETVLTR
jgi:broad specificity phosphatase PhoE